LDGGGRSSSPSDIPLSTPFSSPTNARALAADLCAASWRNNLACRCFTFSAIRFFRSARFSSAVCSVVAAFSSVAGTRSYNSQVARTWAGTRALRRVCSSYLLVSPRRQRSRRRQTPARVAAPVLAVARRAAQLAALHGPRLCGRMAVKVKAGHGSMCDSHHAEAVSPAAHPCSARPDHASARGVCSLRLASGHPPPPNLGGALQEDCPCRPRRLLRRLRRAPLDAQLPKRRRRQPLPWNAASGTVARGS
jgi:hypothetical protein